MIAVVLAAFLASAGSPAKGTTAAPQSPACQEGRLRQVQDLARADARKLNEEPPARQIYTVLRREDGCTKPVFVNDRVIGGAANSH